jgi:hypothetical protein
MTDQTIEEIKRQAELAEIWLDSERNTASYTYEISEALIAANELLQQQQGIIRSLEAKVEERDKTIERMARVQLALDQRNGLTKFTEQDKLMEVMGAALARIKKSPVESPIASRIASEALAQYATYKAGRE